MSKIKKVESKLASKKGDSLDSLKEKDVIARTERLHKKIDLALQEEQFSIRLINRTNPQTLEVNPAIQLVDLKYGDNKA